MSDEPTPPKESDPQWQTEINQLREQIAALALSQTEAQNRLTEALTGQASKTELEALRTELVETRQLLQTAQTALQEIQRRTPEPPPLKDAADHPVPKPSTSRRPSHWL